MGPDPGGPKPSGSGALPLTVGNIVIISYLVSNFSVHGTFWVV